LEARANIHLHDLDSEEDGDANWISCAASYAGDGQLALISPKWKPRPGARLIWPESWGDFKICGSHSELEIEFKEFLALETWADEFLEEKGLLNQDAERWRRGVRRLNLMCLDGDFTLVDVNFLQGVFRQELEAQVPTADSFFLLWYLATRAGERVLSGDLARLGWMIEDHDPKDGAEKPVAINESPHSDRFDPGDSARAGRVGFITLSNEGYVDYTLNSILSLRRLGDGGQDLAKKLICYSIGAKCHEALLAAGCRSILIDDEEHSGFQKFREGAWAGVVRYKFEAMSRELLANEFVCFSDGDIVFESTDFLDDCVARMVRDDVELVIQNDTSNHDDDDHAILCSGFMMIRSTQATRDAFCFEKVAPTVDEEFCDQLYLNSVIRNLLRLSVLPLESYPNGSYFQAFGASPKAKMYHFNYLVGHQKREVMKSVGKWYV